ncbi:MAG: PAS domain S-box protein, partial [Dehalococcoidia bacterium]
RLRILFEFAPDACYLNDLKGTFIDGNRAAEELTGYAREELIGGSFLKMHLLSARQVPKAAARLAQSALRKPTGPDEFILTRKDGDHVTVEIRTFPVTIHGQRLVLGVARDINERKRSQEELAKLHRAVESSGEVVFLTDPEGVFTYVNPEFTRLYGLSSAEVVGKATPRILKSGRCDQENYQVFWQALLAKETVKGQMVNRTKDGRCVDVEVSVSPVLDDDGAIVAFLAIQSDITERLRAERALRQSEADYRDIVEHATYGIYRSTVDGNFKMVNQAFVDMLGYESHADLMATPVVDLYQDPAERDALIERYGTAEQHDGVLVDWKRRDGTPIAVMLKGRHIRDAEGALQAFEVIAQDVTERRMLEAQLRQAQKMEAIGQLTGGIAHDLNNLLSVVIANADVLKDAIDLARDDLHSAIDDIRTASRNGARMVRRLLGFSRRAELEKERWISAPSCGISHRSSVESYRRPSR